MVSLASLEITFDIIMQSSFSCLSLHWEQNKKPRVQMNRLVTNLPRGQSCLLQCFLSVGKIKFLQQNRLPFNLCKSSPGVKGTMHVSLYKRLCLLIPISLHRQCYFNTLNKTKGTIYFLPFELKKKRDLSGLVAQTDNHSGLAKAGESRVQVLPGQLKESV